MAVNFWFSTQLKKGANMKSRQIMLAAAIVAAFGLAGCQNNRAPDNSGN